MKIIYDDIIYSLQKSGGGSVYWTEIIKPTLSEAEHYVYENASENIFYNKIQMANKHILSEKNLLIKRFINPKYKVNEPYIFHSSYFRYSRDEKAINVTTVHDFTVEKFGHGVHSYAHIQQQKEAVRHSQGVVCVSENTKKDFLEYYPWFKGKVVAIPNGYDNSTYYLEKDVEKTRNILFVGARTSYKRFDIAVRIVKALKDCKLIIVGGGNLSEDDKKQLSLLNPNQYEKKGFVDNSELRHLYNEAFFLCYPSEYEGFGIPLLEAQACGCPVVCQNKSSIPEVVNRSAIFVDSEDIDESIDNIKQLYNDDVYLAYQQMGLENIKNYSWNKSAKQHQEFYKELWRLNKK